MKIEHLAIWVSDLERMRDFYQTYFQAKANDLYENKKKKYKSYFLSFEGNENARLELMKREDIQEIKGKRGLTSGLAHFAISVGSKAKVDQLTDQFRKDGYIIEGEPRTTGDGYYESVILDPEGNWLEITI